MNFFVGNLKLQAHSNICQETKVLSYLLLEKTSPQNIFIYAGKATFYPKNYRIIKELYDH